MVKDKIIQKNISFESDLERFCGNLSNLIEESNILVIGGAGTIGSSYIKEILKFKPAKITIVDFNENGLTELTRDLRSSNLLDYKPIFITYPVNLLSEIFDKIFYSERWKVVANFSAHKHVRSEKDKISVEALIKNNVYGAIKLLELCQNNPPQYFFSVSTDKAANPVNIMGASKCLMEKLILSTKKSLRVSTARFANVAFSNGSLLDGFIHRVEKKQPLSCPLDIKRFFVTPEQSGQICLLATFLGESGNIFFPKLKVNKHEIYFKKISLEFLKNNGWDPEVFRNEGDAKLFNFEKNPGKYPIYFFKTDTSGEKKFEEFFTEEEDFDLDTYDSLGVIHTRDVLIDFDEIKSSFDKVFKDVSSEKSDIVNVIKKFVPTFMHIETGRNLDQRM